jgi:hypothetical protein
VRRQAPKTPDGAAIYYSRNISDQHALHTDAYFIPFEVENTDSNREDGKQHQLSFVSVPDGSKKKPNCSRQAFAYLAQIGARNIAAQQITAIWHHALAIGNTPRYLHENADGIRNDWPRIPLPNSLKDLAESAKLGFQIANLLDIESALQQINFGSHQTEIPSIAVIKRVGGGNLQDSELSLTADWGHAGKDGITMPGKGKLLEREYSKAERTSLLQSAAALGLTEGELLANVGETTYDVHLNDAAYWSNVPTKVWNHTIGGYQVIKKWLSYREEALLGRPLSKEEVRYVQETARRLLGIQLLQFFLNTSYESVKENCFDWPTLRTD